MRVRWEKRGPREFVARVDGGWFLRAWSNDGHHWHAEYSDSLEDGVGAFVAAHYSLASERAAKREAARMWRALRGSK